MPTSKRQVGGDYYKRMRIQPWDAMEEWLTADQMRGYLLGSAIAYLARFNVNEPGKGGIVDICKAQHYLDRLVEVTAERCDDDDDTKVPIDFRCPEAIEPGSECDMDMIAKHDVPDMTTEPSRDEIHELNIKMLAESYAKRGFKSSEIATKLNSNGFKRPDGKDWTAYQVAMLIASVPHPVHPNGEGQQQ